MQSSAQTKLQGFRPPESTGSPPLHSVPLTPPALLTPLSPDLGPVQQVLSDFQDHFIADMDANTVVSELLHKDIIPHDVQERISRTDNPKQRNEILHDYLQRTCTEETLMEVCDIIVEVKDHPKMHQLGEAMKKRLHTGKCVVCLCMGRRSLRPPHSTQSPSLFLVSSLHWVLLTPLGLLHFSQSPSSPHLSRSPSLHSVWFGFLSSTPCLQFSPSMTHGGQIV